METEPFIRWNWIAGHLGEIGSRTVQHLELTAIAVGIGFAIAMTLSVLAIRRRVTYTPITWFAGVLYTIPSIALFALLVPVTGLSTVTAEIGLVSHTLLILIRHIVAGIDGVPFAVRDHATAMGDKLRPRSL